MPDWLDRIFCEDCRTVINRIDAARLIQCPPQTDLSSFNASADAIQTQPQNITRENLS